MARTSYSAELYEFNVDANLFIPRNLEINIGQDRDFMPEHRMRFKIRNPPRPFIESQMESRGRARLSLQMRTRQIQFTEDSGWGPWSRSAPAIINEFNIGRNPDGVSEMTVEMLVLEPNLLESIVPLTKGRPSTSESELSMAGRDLPVTFKRTDSHPFDVRAETFETYSNGMMYATFTQPYNSLMVYLISPPNGSTATIRVGGMELEYEIDDAKCDERRLHVDMKRKAVVSGQRRGRNEHRDRWENLPPARVTPPPAPPARQRLPHINVTRPPIVIPMYNLEWGDDSRTISEQLFGESPVQNDPPKPKKKKAKPEPEGKKRMFRLEDDD